MAKPAQFPILRERTLLLSARQNGNGPAKRLRIEPDPYNRIGFSAQAGMKSWINLSLTFDEWNLLLQHVAELASGANFEDKVECMKNNQVIGYIMVGKDSDGVIFVEISENNKGTLRFYALPVASYAHTRMGQPIPESVTSPSRAAAWVKAIQPIMAKCYEAAYKAENVNAGMNQAGYQRNNYGGGNQGGNNNWQQKQNNWGGQQQQSSAPQAQGNLNDYVDL